MIKLEILDETIDRGTGGMRTLRAEEAVVVHTEGVIEIGRETESGIERDILVTEAGGVSLFFSYFRLHFLCSFRQKQDAGH